jgi:hypothetical protein
MLRIADPQMSMLMSTVRAMQADNSLMLHSSRAAAIHPPGQSCVAESVQFKVLGRTPQHPNADVCTAPIKQSESRELTLNTKP